MTHRLTGRVTWGPGPVGDAVRASLEGRLRRFVRDEESEPVALFSPECRTLSDAGEWYGEHLGKWVVAASHAFCRTGDAELGESLRRVVGCVVGWQEADGYLGTYAPGAACRMTSPKAEDVRTWDAWVHAWAILGLLAVKRCEGLETLATGAAVKIGDLILQTFAERSPLDQGNHAGLSAGVVVHPLAELTLATGDPRYAAFALQVVDEMEARLGLLSKRDVAEIGTGKAYQILWCLVGLVALHRATGRMDLLGAAERLWTNVREEHLTPLGGPWGGLQGHKETFAPQGAFSPCGMVETCSAATWMALSRDLFALTGNPQYVEAFERTLMNTLLGALDENGRDWVYFTFPNGRRNNTYHWACCKSSGAMALESCGDLVASATNEAVWLHLLLPCRVEIEGAVVEVAEEGEVFRIAYRGEKPLKVRVPEWAEGGGTYVDVSPTAKHDSSAASRIMASPLGEGRVGVEGLAPSLRSHARKDQNAADPHPTLPQRGGHDPGGRTVDPQSTIHNLRRSLRVVPFTHTVDHHGQEIVRTDYAYLQRGPYVYATGLIDGYKKEETLRLARLTPEAPFRIEGEEIAFHQPGREPIRFAPYYRAGGRHEGAWRTTWLDIAWQ